MRYPINSKSTTDLDTVNFKALHTPPRSEKYSSSDHDSYATKEDIEPVEMNAKVEGESDKITNSKFWQGLSKESEQAYVAALFAHTPSLKGLEAPKTDFASLSQEDKVRYLMPLLERTAQMMLKDEAGGEGELHLHPKFAEPKVSPRAKSKTAYAATGRSKKKEKRAKSRKAGTTSLKNTIRKAASGNPGSQFSSLDDLSGWLHQVKLECRNCGSIYGTEDVDLCPGCGGASGLHHYRNAAGATSKVKPDSEEPTWGAPSLNGTEPHDGCEDMFGLFSAKAVSGESRYGSLSNAGDTDARNFDFSPFKMDVKDFTDWGTGGSPAHWDESDTDTIPAANGRSRARVQSSDKLIHSDAEDSPGLAWGTHKAGTPERKESSAIPYAVTYWATIESGGQTIHIPIDGANVCGPEKSIVDGESCGLKIVWKWVQEKGLGDKVGLQEAFDLAEDIHDGAEKSKEQQEEYVEQETRADHGGRKSPVPHDTSSGFWCSES